MITLGIQSTSRDGHKLTVLAVAGSPFCLPRKCILQVSLSIVFQVVRVPVVGNMQETDTTGAGDLFASGFLHGMVKGLSLEDCCKVGYCSGASVIRAVGGKVKHEN